MESARRGVVAASGSAPSHVATRRQDILLALIVLAGTVLRVLTLNSRSFWLDEATSVRQASWSIPVIIDRMSGNVHPPLFHLLLHWWIRNMGRSEVSVRSFVLLFGVLAIPLAYWVGTNMYERRVGLVAAAIVAFSPYLIWYSQEARMYSMLLFFAFASTGCLYEALRSRSPGWWVAYTISTSAGMFTHFFFGFLVIMQGLYMLVFFVIRQYRDLRARGLLLTRPSRPWLLFKDYPEAAEWLGCLLISLLPVVWWMSKVLGHVQPGGDTVKSLNYGNAVTAGWRFNEIILSVGQASFGIHSQLTMSDLSAIWPLAITVGFLVGGHVRRISPRTWLLVFTGAFGVSAIAIVSQWLPSYEVRYFIPVSAPLVVLFARFIADLRPATARLVCASLIVISLVTYADQGYNPDSILKWDNREAVAAVASGYEPGDSILLVPYYASSVLEYYLPPDMYAAVRGVPVIGPGTGEPRNTPELLAQDLSQQVGQSQRVWVVSSFIEAGRIAEDRKNVIAWLESHGYRERRDLPLHRIRVSLYEAPNDRRFFIKQGGSP